MFLIFSIVAVVVLTILAGLLFSLVAKVNDDDRQVAFFVGGAFLTIADLVCIGVFAANVDGTGPLIATSSALHDAMRAEVAKYAPAHINEIVAASVVESVDSELTKRFEAVKQELATAVEQKASAAAQQLLKVQEEAAAAAEGETAANANSQPVEQQAQ